MSISIPVGKCENAYLPSRYLMLEERWKLEAAKSPIDKKQWKVQLKVIYKVMQFKFYGSLKIYEVTKMKLVTTWFVPFPTHCIISVNDVRDIFESV